MKTILITLFAVAAFCARAQDTTIVGLEYFIDEDPGTGNATSVNIPPGTDVTFPFTVNLAGYRGGYHKLYIRTKDNLGRWSLTARRNFEVLPAPVRNDVVSAEYFIDEDPGYGAAFNLAIASPDTAILLDFNMAAAGLSEGYHKLYGRAKDLNGNWSQTFRRNFEVIKNEGTRIVNGEYFFRTDNGFSECSPVVFAAPSAEGTFSFIIPSGEIPADADTLFLRIREDIRDRWSLTHWTIGLDRTLPLTMLDFKAVRQLDLVRLQWQTTNEIHTDHFTVQRSTDAVHFTSVGKIKAKNNSGSVNQYSHDDNIKGLSAKTIYYRLQEVDIDGRSEYSKIVAITGDGNKPGFRISPNPARNSISIIPARAEDLHGAVVTIVDMAGHTVLKMPVYAGSPSQINVSALAKGMYVVSITRPAGVETRKLLIE